MDFAAVITKPFKQGAAIIATRWDAWQQRRIQSILDEISAVPEGKNLIDTARQAGVAFQTGLKGRSEFVARSIIKQDETVGYKSERIYIPAFFPKGVQMRMLLHELQHCRQNEAKFNEIRNHRILSPDDGIALDRFLEADAESTAIDIAWKLKEAGKPRAWKSCVRSQAMMTGALARFYRKNVTKIPGSDVDGKAKRAVFDAWFVTAPQIGLSVAQLYIAQGLQHWHPEYAEHLAKGGVPFSSLSTDDLRRLGGLSGVNYLDIPARKPLDDPFYREIHPGKGISGLLERSRSEYAGIKSKFNTTTTVANAQPTAASPATATPSVPQM